MKRYVLLFLLIALPAYAAPPTRSYNYTSGTTIVSSQVTANEDNIYNYLQAGTDTIKDGTIVNADINASASIDDGKLDLATIAQNITFNGTSTFSGNVTFSGETIADLGTVTTADINGGTIDATNIGASTPGTGAFSTLKVGTTNQGDILYDNGTSITRLTPGTSGYFLKTQGAAANPVWAAQSGTSNVILSWIGAETATVHVDANKNPAGPTANYMSLFNTSGTYSAVLSNVKWVKIAGVNTITWYARVASSAADITYVQVDVGGANSADQTEATHSTAQELTNTIDVSGLTNGTAYAITVNMKEDGGLTGHLYSIILLGS